MKLPAHLATKYPELLSIENDQALFERLYSDSNTLLNFFSEAVLDETWSESHSKFFEMTLQTFDRLLLQDRLSEESLQKLTKTLYRHPHLTQSHLPQNFLIVARGFSSQVSALLLASTSPLFRDSIRQGQLKRSFDLDPKDVERAIQFIELGQLDDLDTWSEKEILTLLEVAENWNLTALKKVAEKTLAKFLTDEHLFEALLQAHEKKREVYLTQAIQFFNKKYESVNLYTNEENEIILAFYSMIEEALQIFYVLNPILRGLKFTGYTTLDPQFLQIVSQAKHLWTLDVSETETWSPFFLKLPPKIQYFQVSGCPWMDDAALANLKEVLFEIKGLDLGSDSEIGFRGFAELKFFKSLLKLNLENCIQIDDTILNLIIQATPRLQELNLKGCVNISTSGLQNVLNYTQLQKLDLSKTNVSEELLFSLGALQSLSLEKTTLSLDVFKNFLKRQPQLQKLSIKESRLSERSFKELAAQFPHVEIAM